MQLLPSLNPSNIFLESDVRTIVAFSITSKTMREEACLFLNSQFSNLLNFNFFKNENNFSISIEKRIFTKWSTIKLTLDSSSDSCLILEKMKNIFDCLKMFYKVISPNEQDLIKKLDSPCFLKEMLRPDDDDSLWMRIGSLSEKVNSLAFELSKIDLLEDESYFSNVEEVFPVFRSPGGSFFKFCENEESYLYFFEFRNQTLFSHECEINIDLKENMKWKNIKRLYDQFYIDHKFSILTPISDLKAKKEKYLCLRKEVLKMKCFSRKITRKGTERMPILFFCLRFSKKLLDDYGNPEIVLSAKYSSLRPVKHFKMDVANIENLSQFQKAIESNLTSLEKRMSVDATLHTQQCQHLLQGSSI